MDTACRHLMATDLSDLDRLMPLALREAHETGARLSLVQMLTAGAGVNVNAIGMLYYDTSSAFGFEAKTLESWRALAHRQ